MLARGHGCESIQAGRQGLATYLTRTGTDSDA